MAHTQAGNNAGNTHSQNSSSASTLGSMSITTMVHIAAEIMIVGALTYWLNSKIKSQEDQHELLLERLIKCEEQIAKQNEIITHHENALRQFHALLQGLPSPQANKSAKNVGRSQNQPPNKTQPKPQAKPQAKPQLTKPANKQATSPIDSRKNVKSTISNMQSHVEEFGEETELEENTAEIDDLLQSEINELDEGTELECNDDECEVPDQTTLKKKRT